MGDEGCFVICQLRKEIAQGALLVKLDIFNAFRLFQVRPEDFSWLGFTLEGKFHIYKCLPMGCSYHAHCLKNFSFFTMVFSNLYNTISLHNSLYLDEF